MSTSAIDNLVRALTHPYVGAHCLIENKPVKIWKIKKHICKKHNIEPGKIIQVKGKKVIVKTFDGTVELVNHEIKKLPKAGDYLKW